MSKKIDLRRIMSVRIKDIRDALAYTQGRMGSLFGLTRSGYSKYENGMALPGHLFLEKLGNDCNVSLDWFICGKGSMFYEEKQEGAGIKKDRETIAKGDGEKKFSMEHMELIEQMEKSSLLHYEVMAFYHRFKKANREMFEEDQKSPVQEPAAEK